MQVEIELIKTKILCGVKFNTSLHLNNTFLLWQNFMQNKNKIPNILHADLFSVEIYPSHYFEVFDPTVSFEKWAASEVSNKLQVLEDFDYLTIPEGLYAKFLYKGHPQNAQASFHYIFTDWLPQSNYLLDQRPHFELMGKGYKNNQPDSEEFFYIPIKPKT